MTGLRAARALRAGDHESFDFPEPGRSLTAVHQDLALRVRVDDASPTRSLFGLPPTAALTEDELRHWQHCLDEAWRTLVTRHRPAAEVLTAVLRVIVPVLPDPDAEGISATSAEAFGAVAMSAPADPTALTVGLLHETMHSVLNAVNLLFDLVRPGGEPGYSPWRDDPRPAPGVLHGAYAYLAVTRFWRTELQASPSSSPSSPSSTLTPPPPPAPPRSCESGQPRSRTDQQDRGETGRDRGKGGPQHEQATPPRSCESEQPHPRIDQQDRGEAGRECGDAGRERGGTGWERGAAFEFARWRGAVAEAAEGLLGGGELTPAGARFVSALLDEVRPWLAEPVDAEAARLAGLARADHRLRWRLRNLAVTPPDAAELARAWRDGRKPPEVSPIPAASSGRALENSPRLRLIRAHLKGEAADSAAAGDDACVRGDLATALRSYEMGLEKDRDQDLGWAGLALVSPHPALRSRPEVVKAAALALPDVPIAALADWLSG
ncbi:HEXXH motif-containing putative peptide modification protein [Actinoplanes sp. NPDC023714]|uniref:aKG-HExxH-type peptide beta-hydroxylase n=1 Tax=Actinoplanes sp. NPDC023714 TaxID=3154322 RepID=UPI0033C8F18F